MLYFPFHVSRRHQARAQASAGTVLLRLLPPGFLAAALLFSWSGEARAEWPDVPSDIPSITEIEDAASDSGWTAGTNTIWNLTWAKKVYYLGWLPPDKSEEGREPTALPGPRRELPSSWDWTSVDGENHVSPVKNQADCGSCWAFAACGVLESLREIKGKTDCGFDDLSEQFVVSCCETAGGCEGGSAPAPANFLRDTGTPDEDCLSYQAKDSVGGVPCSDRCDDWSDRLRKITSWSYVRDGGLASQPGAVDSLKQAVYNAPQWVTFLVYADFYAYKSGVYRHVLGPYVGGHAVVLVGYDDDNSCFICKNSWGKDWGESGYFRIAYSQVYSTVRFGGYCVSYSLDAPGGGGVGFDYSAGHGAWDWRTGNLLLSANFDNWVAQTTLPFSASTFCSGNTVLRISTNGWVGLGAEVREESWPDHYPIPEPAGPTQMLAPLWTDLDASIPGAEILTAQTPDHRFVVEYRNILNKSNGTLETFEVQILDPAWYPTRTGDAIVQFQYQQHAPTGTYHTVGIESRGETNGIQCYYNGQGEPIAPYTALEFRPLGHGDEREPLPAILTSLFYDEPYVRMGWDNPVDDVANFPLLFLTGVVVERDGEPIADLLGSPGEAMTYDYRELGTGSHTYTVRPYVGQRPAAAAGGPLSIPARVDTEDHDIGGVLFTVSDQGTCGFLDAGQTQGQGFRYPPSAANCLYIASLWAGTSPQYALNRDYLEDPFADWLVLDDLVTPDPSISDQDFRAAFDDGGHAVPRGLKVTQDSWAWSDPPDDGFVIVRYRLENTGAEPINGLFAGVFADWDVGTDPWHNQGGVNADLKLVYMWHGTGLPYAGIALLDSLPTDPPPANLSLVHNATYVYPQSYLLDEDRWEFLSAADPAHTVLRSPQPDDWGVVASAGPFDLPPGGVARAVFAFVGGSDEADLLANAAAAQSRYAQGASMVDDITPRDLRVRLLPSRPNPFRGATLVSYSLPVTGRVEVSVHDAAGRLVRVLARESQEAGEHRVIWDGRGESGQAVASGAYFIRLTAAGHSATQRLVRVR